MKVVERNRAQKLRRERGLSIRTIAAELAVSPSTVGRWVQDIDLTAEQHALRAANPIYNRQLSGTTRSQANARTRRRLAQADGQARAAVGDPLHQLGCMLYWAEGSKFRNQVVFTNADADMVELFLRFLRRCYGTADDEVALTVNVHLGNGLTVDEIHAWWLGRLRLPSGCLHPAVVNRTSRASQRKRRTLPYGTIRLAVCSTFVVQSIYGAIQAYAGIERPEWLDCGPAQTLRASPPSTSSEVPVM